MKRGASESSDAMSQATSSPPRTTKQTPNNKRQPAYYVQSPSHDGGGGGGDKSSSSTTAHTTPVFNSPLESSPSHASSTGRHSRISSATRISGTLTVLRSSSPATSSSATATAGDGRKRLGGDSGHHKRKRWREVGGVIDEESAYEYDDIDQEQEGEEEELPGWCAVVSWLAVLALAFAVACLAVWGAARRCKPAVVAKSLTVHNFYAGEGTDHDTGVPTKLVTLNCSLAMSVHNPSKMFGIHVSSSSIRLMYSEIVIASGQLHKFYQPRKSRRAAVAILHGEKTPLYGAGATLAVSDAGGKGGSRVSLTLELAVRSRGHVIGRLVRVTHAVRVRCPVAIHPGSSRPVRFRRRACSYRHR